MNTPDVDLHLEAANAKKKGATRMYWAREQLKTILARLAKQPNQYRVGLLAYGSRYAYDKRAEDDPEARANKMKYFRGRPPSGGDLALIAQPTAEQDPDTDCEELLKLADFDENQRAIAESKLDGLKATGQTPLYYSVVKAIELLKEDRENRGHKRIVVITDGINDQSYLVDAKDKRIKNDVAWALKEANKSIDVRLEVIAFCIKPDPGQEEAQYRENLEDLKSLVQEQKQGGSYAASDRPEGLLGALEKLVETEKFVLCQGERQLAESMRTRGSIWTCRPAERMSPIRSASTRAKVPRPRPRWKSKGASSSSSGTRTSGKPAAARVWCLTRRQWSRPRPWTMPC